MFVMAEAARTNGRPRQFVDRQQLEFLRSMHFTWEDIANLLGVSVKTLKRRAKEWGIKTFSVISDCDLDHAVSEYLCESPFSGEAMINGHLRSGTFTSNVQELGLPCSKFDPCLEIHLTQQ